MSDNGSESLDSDEELDDESEELTPSEADENVSARERLEAEADRAVTEFDEGVVDLLAWVLDTETRARIYVYLRQHPNSTSDEVAEGTGLYPSTVREALAQLHDEGTVDRHKRESAGAGNNPYEYEAIAPSSLVRGVVGQVQEQLNAVFNLDRRLGEDGDDDRPDAEPVRITVEDDEE
ncbi:helix-turn-helix domain-containing protein [Haloplanus aerogenes]|uniref:Sugar-specific transcriptional regulator TrmB n=1 Tax=Haloplanus aerogenes TaxID=660522 RepID=A0A3M0DST5_9EURY|nr:helix-turn-helix domain-containing protein [Haloplanus aerogenes]AZH25457.1 winged helix-turn-helix transcriptional regulator [Haloplanus aerogenes]RMB25169.1 sugar-specific transcriptional regulator TrmB [Haloplanus aerogenes]